MVVEQDDRRGAGSRRLAENLARVDDARVERADRNDDRPQDAVLRVEQDGAELLDRAIAIARQQQLGEHPRRRHLHPLGRPASAFGVRAPRRR